MRNSVFALLAFAMAAWLLWMVVVTAIPGGWRLTLVQRVVDGDTFVTRRGLGIRVAGIDAPRGSTFRGELARKRLQFLCLLPVLVYPTGQSYDRQVCRVYAFGFLSVKWFMVLTLGAAPWDYGSSTRSPLERPLWRILIGKKG